MKQSLGNGFWMEPMTEEHEQAAVDAINAYYRWMNGGDFATLQDMQVDWHDEKFSMQEDTRIVFDTHGSVVAYGDVWDISSLHVRYYSIIAVLPTLLDQGLGERLLAWAVERAGQKVSQAPEGARVVMHVGVNSQNEYAQELFEGAGFHVARSSYRMRIDFDAAPPAPQVPEGIVIRPLRPGIEERAALFASYDSFKDHWGTVNEPFEEYYNRWMRYIEEDPNYDPSLHFVAVQDDEVVGVSLCYSLQPEDPDMAWVQTLGVRRDWRRSGVGQALLQHSLRAFYDMGKRKAGLGVDAENLTGALRLYEKVGMHVARKNNTYELELREGVNLMRQKIEEA